MSALEKKSIVGETLPNSALLRIDRIVLAWLNRWPGLPEEIGGIVYPILRAAPPCMALTNTDGVYRTDLDILGGYEAACSFHVACRFLAAESMDRSLQADELLNSLGLWCEENPPDIPGCVTEGVEIVDPAGFYEPREQGEELHAIQLRVKYRVKGAAGPGSGRRFRPASAPGRHGSGQRGVRQRRR